MVRVLRAAPRATTKPIVVVVWVEQGGFGDVAAAPVARQILSQWFFGKPGPYMSGKLGDAVSTTPIQTRRTSAAAARARAPLLAIDPLLLLAAIGLVALLAGDAQGGRRRS